MKCTKCIEEGLKSTVHVGVGQRTLLYSPPYYDENGNYHNHDPNTLTTSYSCSNGHTWEEKSKAKCWCGWPQK